jgi:hypothetical protein
VIWLAALALFSIDPPVITDCMDGLGQATLSWSDAGGGRVQVRVGSHNGDALTGWETGAGSARTGWWVRDGMTFYLAGEDGADLGRVAASVRCGYTPNNADAAFLVGSYFPLQAGNQWTYRMNSRQITGAYQTWEITGTREMSEHTYSVLRLGGTAEWLLRVDDAGRIYRSVDGAVERLWLDPTVPPDPDAVWRVTGRGGFTSPLGAFPDALNTQRFESLIFETGVFVRGLGMATSTSSVVAGSSGGFGNSLDLVEARIGGKLLLIRPAPRVELGAEQTVLRVSEKKVSNCAVPCYFTACGLVPGADPPNTWKPCFEVRTKTDGDAAEVSLENWGGRVLRRMPVAAGQGYLSMPLYSEPNQPYPPGAYRLTLKAAGGEAALAITVE